MQRESIQRYFEARFAGDGYGVAEGLGEGGHGDGFLVGGEGGEGGGYDALFAPAVGECEVWWGVFQI